MRDWRGALQGTGARNLVIVGALANVAGAYVVHSRVTQPAEFAEVAFEEQPVALAAAEHFDRSFAALIPARPEPSAAAPALAAASPDARLSGVAPVAGADRLAEAARARPSQTRAQPERSELVQLPVAPAPTARDKPAPAQKAKADPAQRLAAQDKPASAKSAQVDRAGPKLADAAWLAGSSAGGSAEHPAITAAVRSETQRVVNSAQAFDAAFETLDDPAAEPVSPPTFVLDDIKPMFGFVSAELTDLTELPAPAAQLPAPREGSATASIELPAAEPAMAPRTQG